MSHAKNLKEKDGGLSSRKLWLTVFAMALVFGAGCLAAFWPNFAPNLSTIVSGVVGSLSLYLVGNVSSKFVIGKTDPANRPPPKK